MTSVHTRAGTGEVIGEVYENGPRDVTLEVPEVSPLLVVEVITAVGDKPRGIVEMRGENISRDERRMHGVRIAPISAEILYDPTSCGGNGCAVDADRRVRGASRAAAHRRQHDCEPDGYPVRHRHVLHWNATRRTARERNRHGHRAALR